MGVKHKRHYKLVLRKRAEKRRELRRGLITADLIDDFIYLEKLENSYKRQMKSIGDIKSAIPLLSLLFGLANMAKNRK